MRNSLTLSYYIARQFLTAAMIALAGLLLLALLIDMLELIRRAAGKDQATFGILLKLAFLKAPYEAEKFLPFAMLIGGMMALTKMTRSQELIIMRAAGVSVWQFLTPALAAAALLGVLFVAVFNPVSSAMLMRFEQVEAKYLSGRSSLLSVSSSGLWLRQIEQGKPGVSEHLIHAQRVSSTDMAFENVILFTFDQKGRFKERLDAETARLEPGVLRLRHVVRSVPGLPPEAKVEYELPTNLEIKYIQDSFASPETMSFWHLPTFIGMLEKAGFSALKHRLYWQSLLAKPLLLCAMVLVAAIFSLRLPRRGGVWMMTVAGLVFGFLLYFFTDLIFAIGSTGSLPVGLAAWSPAVVVALASVAALLHFEDG